MPANLLIAAFLLAHAGIHVSFIAPRPPVTAGGPSWPFVLGRSWVLTPLGFNGTSLRRLGAGLIATSIGAYTLAALAVLGLAPEGLWVPAVATGSLASIALIVAFFHPWLALGIAIDAVLLLAVLIAGWIPAGVATG